VPTKPASFNGTCVDLLPVTTLDDAIGRPIIGRTNFIVGVAEPNIGRLAYLNCKYGVSTAKVKTKMVTTTKLEIGISLYKTGDQAISRVTGTVQDYRGNGATSSDTAVGEYSGTILLGYGDPTLVVAAGPRTVAVTIASSFVPAAARNKALIDAANIALKSTQTFSQGGPVTVTDSASPSASSS
jgi:hypothetical protein